jgi:hypothetical protein
MLWWISLIYPYILDQVYKGTVVNIATEVLQYCKQFLSVCTLQS